LTASARVDAVSEEAGLQVEVQSVKDVRDIEQRLFSFVRNSTEARSVLSRLHDMNVESIDIQTALVEVLKLDDPIYLLERNLSAADMIEQLRDFNFSKYHPELLAEIELDESLIPEGIPRLLTEATIKNRGEVWRVHKNDADPFPSNPHAENYASGLRLNLSTGGLFRKREELGRIGRKELLEIRGRAESKGVSLPPLIV
jgi:hypothetical protein